MVEVTGAYGRGRYERMSSVKVLPRPARGTNAIDNADPWYYSYGLKKKKKETSTARTANAQTIDICDTGLLHIHLPYNVT